jgi:hypothetical protein
VGYSYRKIIFARRVSCQIGRVLPHAERLAAVDRDIQATKPRFLRSCRRRRGLGCRRGGGRTLWQYAVNGIGTVRLLAGWPETSPARLVTAASITINNVTASVLHALPAPPDLSQTTSPRTPQLPPSIRADLVRHPQTDARLVLPDFPLWLSPQPATNNCYRAAI